MRCKMKSLVFVLFLMKEITSIRSSTRESRKHDLTIHLNRTINKLFQSVKTVIVTHLLKKIQNLEPQTYEYNLTHPIDGFQDRIIFRDTSIQDFCLYMSSKHIDYDFINDKIQIVLHEADVHFGADVHSAEDTYYGSFFAVMEIESKCLINVVKLPETDPGYKIFQIDMQFFDLNNITYRIFNESVTNNTKLVKEIESRLPSILLDNMNNNEILTQALYDSYGFQPKKHLIAKRKNFSNNEPQYYYRIPTAQYFCFNLKNITIKGLSNFQSLKYHRFPRTAIHTLLIKDVRGNATLDYGRESDPPLRLHFYIDYLTISQDGFADRYGRGFKVGGHWCSVRRVRGNTSLTNVQTEGVIRSIESAFAFSLTPQLDVWKAHEMENPIGQKCSELLASLSWEEMKESFKKWIPFNED
ncbi:uncharacterized protein LOC135837284 [Planococcus citri]|uniref:uncharacterized protein LOC135837284 n=1 Tax=Planococcus citri TaxID=170843 RepID=UPI0031FA3815